jgi:hypothetical protein
VRRSLRPWEGLLVRDNWLFVSAAFAVTWAVLLGYLVHVHRTLRRARSLLADASAPGSR